MKIILFIGIFGIMLGCGNVLPTIPAPTIGVPTVTLADGGLTVCETVDLSKLPSDGGIQ